MEIDLGYQDKVVVFDLDDTLYQEVDYVYSAYKAIDSLLSERYSLTPGLCFDALKEAFLCGDNPFDFLAEVLGIQSDKYTIDISELLSLYRYHEPFLKLECQTEETINAFQKRGIKMGIITDGRSKTQRNKIKALSLDKYIAPYNIIKSEEIGFEKTSFEPFRHFVNRYPNASEFIYIGDNPAKDFYNPNLMGWKTIMLIDKGTNIHSQTEESSKIHSPQIKINEITELLEII